MVREESQEILKFSCNLSLVKTPTYRDSLSFKPAETLKNAVNEKDDTVSWYCHPQCVYLCIRVCVCYMCVSQEMGFLCQQPRTMCHNTLWSKSITENSFPSSITVFDSSECEWLKGSFTAGCPPSKTIHETGKSRRGECFQFRIKGVETTSFTLYLFNFCLYYFIFALSLLQFLEK